MTKAVLKKGNVIYRFEQYDNGYEVVGEEEKTRGLTKCIMYKECTKKWGNDFYKELVSKGYRRV